MSYIYISISLMIRLNGMFLHFLYKLQPMIHKKHSIVVSWFNQKPLFFCIKIDPRYIVNFVHMFWFAASVLCYYQFCILSAIESTKNGKSGYNSVERQWVDLGLPVCLSVCMNSSTLEPIKCLLFININHITPSSCLNSASSDTF